MALYIRNEKTKTYYFDFRYKGKRFSGDSEKTRRRDAEELIQEIKRQHDLTLASRKGVDQPTVNMTVADACTRFWEDKHDDIVDSDKLAWSLGWIEHHFTKTARLVDIGDNEIAKMVAKRRGEPRINVSKLTAAKRRGKSCPDERPISKATVNRTVTEPMRQIITRARKVWKVPVQDIDWSLHMLADSQEIVREASVAEQAAVFTNLKRGYDKAIFFAFRMGARLEEILNLDWPHINFFTDKLTLDGKGNKKRIVPIPADVRALLWGLKDDHPVKVFTYVAAYTRRATSNSPATVRGDRYPLTASGLQEAFKLATSKAGITGFRLHDTRHTAATAMLRATGNLRVVQKLLGHTKIDTTMKYAHVTDDDLVAAMEKTRAHHEALVAKSPTKIPTERRLKAAND